MSKQVKGSAIEAAALAVQILPNDTTITTTTAEQRTRNLYVKVDTFDVDGKTVGTRIVDMYHFGTRNWLQGHHWWAMHHNHTVEVMPANADEIGAYMSAQKQALADKFNNEKTHNAA